MNNDEYLSALKQALSGMDRRSREEILREIRSHLNETSTADSLESRFGPVKELAAQYLDGETITPSIFSRIGRVSKALLLGFGLFCAAIIAFIATVAWIYSADRFDYAAESLVYEEFPASDWSSTPWTGSSEINISQAEVVIYWHDQSEIRWYYEGRGELNPVAGSALEIRHGFALLYLPKNTATVSASQASLVLIQPQSLIALTLDQSEVRIAENGSRYHYQLALDHAKFDGLNSDENADAVIQITARESNVGAYSY